MERSLSGSRFSSIGWRCGSGSGSSTGAEGPPSSTSCGPPMSAYRRPRPSPPQPRPRNRPAPYTPRARRGVNALSSSVQSVVCYSVRVKLLTSALDTGPDVRGCQRPCGPSSLLRGSVRARSCVTSLLDGTGRAGHPVYPPTRVPGSLKFPRRHTPRAPRVPAGGTRALLGSGSRSADA